MTLSIKALATGASEKAPIRVPLKKAPVERADVIFPHVVTMMTWHADVADKVTCKDKVTCQDKVTS